MRVVKKLLRASDYSSGNIKASHDNAVDGADALCAEGYLAVFSDGVNRIATVSPNAGDGQVDWVLAPWTAYYRFSDDFHIGTTDGASLLGVADGAAVALENEPWMGNAVWTGLNQDWTAATDINCLGWTDETAAQTAPIGNGGFTDRRFLRISGFSNTCDWTRPVYCAEQ